MEKNKLRHFSEYIRICSNNFFGNFRAASCANGLKRTVVFMKYQSQWGQHLFYRGGIDYAKRPRKHNTKQYTCCLGYRC